MGHSGMRSNFYDAGVGRCQRSSCCRQHAAVRVRAGQAGPPVSDKTSTHHPNRTQVGPPDNGPSPARPREDFPPRSSPPPAVSASAPSQGGSSAPPPSSLPSSAGKRWTPPSTLKPPATAGPPPSQAAIDRNDAIFRKVRSILNKLTPDKFDKLSLELLNVGIDSQTVLKGIILLIFDKALDEPKYSSLYAQLCHRLCQDAPNFEPQPSNTSTFRRLLLTKCQDEFENRSRASEAFEKAGPLSVEEAEACSIAKAKMLGNIKFIGELGKLDMLHEGIMHKCIKQLLEKKKAGVKDMSEDLECLCQILRTIGKMLDRDKARAWVDQYFERIRTYQAHPDLPSRIRFMLQDVTDLRTSHWQPRRTQGGEGAPRTIQQVREEVAIESGLYIPGKDAPPVLSPTYLMTDPFFGPPTPLNGAPARPPGGLADMFATMQPHPYSGGSSPWGGAGGGGGVLHIDTFAKGYNKQQRGGGGFSQSGYDHQVSGGRRNDDDTDPPGGPPPQGGLKYYRGGGRGRGGGNYGDHVGGRYGGGENRSDDDELGPGGGRRGGRGGYGGPADGGYDSPGGGGGRDYGYQGGAGGGGGHFEDKDKHGKNSATQPPVGGRELPPRFLKKQQQQQQLKDSPPTSDTYLGGSYGGPGGGGPPRVMYQQPGVYQPSMPMMPGIMTPPPPRQGFSTPPGGRGVGPGGGGAGGVGGEDVSLRPARNFTPSLRPNTPGMLPKSAQPAGPAARAGGGPLQGGAVVTPGPPSGGPLSQKQITVIQVPSLDKHKGKDKDKEKDKVKDKDKVKEKDKDIDSSRAGATSSPAGEKAAVATNGSEEQVKQSMDALLRQYLDSGDVEEAVSAVKQMKLNKKLLPALLCQAMLYGLQKSDAEQECISGLSEALKHRALISDDCFSESFRLVLAQLAVLERDNLLARSHIARYGAQAVASGVSLLADLAVPLVGGACYPLFLLLLQQLAKLREQDWVVATFNESKVNLPDMLPELNKDKVLEVLEDRGLSFLLPLLRVQSELWKQLEGAEPNPVAYYKWIKDNVDARLHSDPTFITLLVTTVLRYVTTDTTLREGIDVMAAPSKADVDAEKLLLNKFKGVLQKFLLDKPALHVTALYAVQVYAHNNNSPRGLVLRMFEALYDLGVVYEEAFLQWKEEVNELHPGKGKALFQVNQWLMWLEQASEESDDEG